MAVTRSMTKSAPTSQSKLPKLKLKTPKAIPMPPSSRIRNKLQTKMSPLNVILGGSRVTKTVATPPSSLPRKKLSTKKSPFDKPVATKKTTKIILTPPKTPLPKKPQPKKNSPLNRTLGGNKVTKKETKKTSLPTVYYTIIGSEHSSMSNSSDSSAASDAPSKDSFDQPHNVVRRALQEAHPAEEARPKIMLRIKKEKMFDPHHWRHKYCSAMTGTLIYEWMEKTWE